MSRETVPIGTRCTSIRALAVLAGGAAGTLVRAGLEEEFAARPGQWPWTTFGVNVAGTLILAWLATRLISASPRYLLLGTGFCGALTTFSTLQVETLRLVKDGHAGVAVSYAAASLAAGILAAVAASAAARRRQAT